MTGPWDAPEEFHRADSQAVGSAFNIAVALARKLLDRT
jgi:hypothetical protein